MSRSVLAIAVALVLTAACAACTESREPVGGGASGGSGDDGEGALDTSAAGCDTDDLLACARSSTLAPAVPDDQTAPVAADDGAEPFVIGMVNQESSPVASYPELSVNVRAGVDFVNAELGGIDGHPLELEVCNTDFSAEGSTACGQRFVGEGVSVVLGGIDVFGNAIETLDANGIPYVGGIPVTAAASRSPNSFQWSGGIYGAVLAFAHQAGEVDGVDSVAIIYGDFGPIAEAARFGKQALEAMGVPDVELVSHPIVSPDLMAPVQVAAAGDPDAVFVLEADSGCGLAFDAIASVGLDAQPYYVGACAATPILDEAGPAKTEGARFNIEQELRGASVVGDTDLYFSVVGRYGGGFEAGGAGTVSFRSFMNLYLVLRGLGADHLDAAAITSALRSQRDTPSFMGHSYTCDGEQFGTLTALCSPQQILVELSDGELHQLGGWIDVGEVMAMVGVGAAAG